MTFNRGGGTTDSFGNINTSSEDAWKSSLVAVAVAVDSAEYFQQNKSMWADQPIGEDRNPYAVALNPNQKLPGENWDHGYGESPTPGWSDYEITRAQFYNAAVQRFGGGDPIDLGPPNDSVRGGLHPRPGEYSPGLTAPSPQGEDNEPPPPPPVRRRNATEILQLPHRNATDVLRRPF